MNAWTAIAAETRTAHAFSAAGRGSGANPAAGAPAAERRSGERQRRRLGLTISVFNREAFFDAELCDFGPGGMGMESERRLSAGTSIYVRLVFRPTAGTAAAGAEPLRTSTLAEVKWCRELADERPPRYRIGVRYYIYY